MINSPALRYHGGKFRVAPWIISHFPPHKTYVEPYGGAASVLLRKPRSHGEVYNDLDGEIVAFFRVMQQPVLAQRLIEQLVHTPYARSEYELAFTPCSRDDLVERARRTAIRAGMGFGSSGATKKTCGFRVDTKREYSTAQHVWARYPDTIAAICERFAGVLIEEREAVHVMLQHDSPTTLHYVDPPYVHSTRTERDRAYRHELNNAAHEDLLVALSNLSGMVALSGYRNDLYDAALHGWVRVEKEVRAAGQRGSVPRTECLWLNPALVNASSRLEAA